MALSSRQVAPGLVHHCDQGVQGGFNRSSNTPTVEVCDGSTEGLDYDDDRPGSDAFAGTPWREPRRSAVVLGRGREGLAKRGGRARLRRVAGCRFAVVPRKWRNATNHSHSVRSVFIVCRTGRDRVDAGAGCRSPRDRPPIGSIRVNHLQRLRRNAATRGGVLHYRASTAQWKAERQARRPKPAKLALNEQLRTYVQERLAGRVEASDGRTVHGPQVAWGARRHGRRKDRRWATAWSPEQIAGRLPIDFPEDESMRISHEAIYQGLYVEGRGGLRRELSACLRTGRTLRKPRARTKRTKHFLSPEVRIDRRPQEAADRSVAGHWEGDLILGLGGTAIGTLVERATRFTMLLHLPPLDGHGTGPRPKNSPALAGHGAEAVREAIASRVADLPTPLRRSLSWDQGAEMSQHEQLREMTGLPVYFCDPHSPWQRPSNENTNGLLRQYFPKGTDLSRYSREDLDAVAAALNNRPRKTHDWLTATEMFDEQLTLQKEPGVATTG